ncbi:MAG: hypothetical protein Q8R28_12915, partial [Dehalococcoidia bacterium]|nr:hypothetical protein [Dehalococcoidia bacterium]
TGVDLQFVILDQSRDMENREAVGARTAGVADRAVPPLRHRRPSVGDQTAWRLGVTMRQVSRTMFRRPKVGAQPRSGRTAVSATTLLELPCDFSEAMIGK